MQTPWDKQPSIDGYQVHFLFPSFFFETSKMRLMRFSILCIAEALHVSLAAPQATDTTVTSRTTSVTTTASRSDASSTPSLVAAVTRSWPRTLQHGSFTGTPTTTGAVSASQVGTGIVVGPPDPAATTYVPNGELQEPQPAPYVPNGGRGTNMTPTYQVKSDFDYQSLVRHVMFPVSLVCRAKPIGRPLRCTRNGSNSTSSERVWRISRLRISRRPDYPRKTEH